MKDPYYYKPHDLLKRGDETGGWFYVERAGLAVIAEPGKSVGTIRWGQIQAALRRLPTARKESRHA